MSLAPYPLLADIALEDLLQIKKAHARVSSEEEGLLKFAKLPESLVCCSNLICELRDDSAAFYYRPLPWTLARELLPICPILYNISKIFLFLISSINCLIKSKFKNINNYVPSNFFFF